MIFLVGLTLLVPHALMLGTLAVAIVDVNLLARLVEEPHLLELHGEEYRAYARRVGRFVPGLGRWA
jgi:protein-S-isoprenylcysteine O-methyltransferase Ste14